MSLNPDAFVDALTQRVNEENLDIPMLPDVALRVIQLTNDPKSDAQSLMKVVQNDQALAARIMSTANSAAYAGATTIDSLQQAIARMGMTAVCNIALAASMNARMFRAPGLEGHVENIWQHSLATALWCQELARGTTVNPDTGFLSGLLSHVGLPIMLQEVVEIAEQAELMEEVDLIMETAADLAPEAARLALNRWHMPESIARPIILYRDYANAGEHRNTARLIAAAVHFADWLCTEYPEPEELLNFDAVAELELKPQRFDALMAKSDSIRSALETMHQ